MLLAGEWVPRWTQVHIPRRDRKSTRLNSSHSQISYAVFCLKKKSTTGSLAQYLTLTVTRGTDPSPSFPNCGGFQAATGVYCSRNNGIRYHVRPTPWRGPYST